MSDGIWEDVAEMNAMSRKAEIKPKKGEKWRVTIEAEVFYATSNGEYVDFQGGSSVHVSEGTWERLPDPEPEWQPGDLVIDANDEIYRRRPSTARRSEEYPWDHYGDWLPDSAPKRPLTRLIRES